MYFLNYNQYEVYTEFEIDQYSLTLRDYFNDSNDDFSNIK